MKRKGKWGVIGSPEHVIKFDLRETEADGGMQLPTGEKYLLFQTKISQIFQPTVK